MKIFKCADCKRPIPAPATEWYTPTRPPRCERCQIQARKDREYRHKLATQARRKDLR